jgi:hypothetical protein
MRSARLVHRMPGRARIRIPAERSNDGYFRELEKQLGAFEGVRDVATRPLTGSVVLLHEGELTDVLDRAEREGLFAVRSSDLEDKSLLGQISDGISELDEEVKKRTDSRWDLSTMGFFALLGASAYQLARGDFLPKGGALALHALALLNRTVERERNERGAT